VTNIKALIVVLGLAWPVFFFSKRVLVRLRLMEAEIFDLRRNAWLITTTAAFISPNFWLYALALTIVLVKLHKRDPNPASLYLLLLHVIPPMSFQIPTVGIQSLLPISQYRLLTLFVLVPVALGLRSLPRSLAYRHKFLWPDIFIAAYLCWQLLLLLPYGSLTGSLRAAVIVFIDVYIPYYVFSRLALDRVKLLDAFLCGLLALAIMSVAAAFESIRHWLLFVDIGTRWGDVQAAFYLTRAGVLRAEASAGHALALGYMLAVAFGFGLFLRDMSFKATLGNRIRFPLLIPLIFWLGLLGAYSKGPWLVAFFIMILYLALSRPRMAGLARAVGATILLTAAVLASPLSSTIIDNLPFIGTVDEGSVDYRTRLAQVSWNLMWQSPFTGNPFAIAQMEELRTGEGIIDLLNAYLSVGMFYGVTGLLLFVAPFVIAVIRLYLTNRQEVGIDPDRGRMTAAMLAGLLGTMIMMGILSFGSGLERYAYVLVAAGCGVVSVHSAKQYKSRGNYVLSGVER
jgi:hypothetical protein